MSSAHPDYPAELDQIEAEIDSAIAEDDALALYRHRDTLMERIDRENDLLTRVENRLRDMEDIEARKFERQARSDYVASVL